MSRMPQIVVMTRKDGITDSNGPETAGGTAAGILILIPLPSIFLYRTVLKIPTIIAKNIDCALTRVISKNVPASIASNGVNSKKETKAVKTHCKTFVSSFSASDFAREMTTSKPPIASVALLT